MIKKNDLLKLTLLITLLTCIFSTGYYYFVLVLFLTPLVLYLSTNARKNKLILIALSIILFCSFILTLGWFLNLQVLNIDVLRDYIFLFKFVNGFIFGMLLISDDIKFKDYEKPIFFACALYLLLYFFSILKYAMFQGDPFSLTPNAFRVQFGAGEFLVPFVFIYLLDKKKNTINYISIILLFFVMLIMQSRTMIILVLAYLSYSIVIKNGKINYSTLMLLFLGSVFLLSYSSLDLRRSVDGDSFSSKILSSLTEALPSDYDDMSDIGYHWRGYESYWAINKLANSNYSQILLGHGAGAKVELPIYMKLGGNEYNALPFIHNGYFMILIKGGLTLCAIFIFWHLSILRRIIINKCSLVYSRLIYSVCIFSLASTFFMSGVFEANDWSSLVIVFGMMYAEFSKRSLVIPKG